MKGVYLSITDTSSGMRAGGTYDVTLDAQGKIANATDEPRGTGFDRIISPWPPKPRPAPAPRPAAPAGARGRSPGWSSWRWRPARRQRHPPVPAA